jgi:hypothetical protein
MFQHTQRISKSAGRSGFFLENSILEIAAAALNIALTCTERGTEYS